MNKTIVKLGFVSAAIANIGGVLLFSRLFSNEVISASDPVVMSTFGLVMIMVWGLAYLGAAAISSSVRWLAAAFAIEKLVYVIVWCQWMFNNSISNVYSQDLYAGLFYTIYGPNDFLFMVFFILVFLKSGRSSAQV